MRARSGGISSTVSSRPTPDTIGEGPPQRVDEQPQIAGATDDAVHASRNQRMFRLDGDQPAEPMAEHKDGRLWLDQSHRSHGNLPSGYRGAGGGVAGQSC